MRLSAEQTSEKKIILVVEDDLVTVTLLDATLKPQGYDLIIAHNGKNALSLLQSVTPHLIISDVIMPEMNGFEFYKQIKKNSVTANIPVIILTGHQAMADTFAVMGVDEFFVKPINTQKLLERVIVLLAREKKPAISASIALPDVKPEKKVEFTIPREKIIIGLIIVALLFGLYFMVSAFSSSWQKKKMGAPEYIDRGDQSKEFM